LTDRKLPTGRFGRVARMARVGARTGASLLLSKDGSAAAEQALEVLGTLRGLAAKVGQMASYVDGFLPEAHRKAYERALSALRTAAPTSSPEAVRKLVEQELGEPIDRLYAEWEAQPFASASIGQVHRARLTDGREVAVKVQHPGIERAVASDLDNAGVIASLIATIGPKEVGSRAMFDEVRARFLEELDYRLEAERQAWFARLHAGDPQIEIPEVIGERSSRRVLTSVLAHGQTLEQAATAGPQARRAWAEVLWRFVFKGNLVGGMFNADPHPGNYLFPDDQRVIFLDFGCVQAITPTHQERARALHRAALARHEAAFADAARHLLNLRGGGYEKASIAFARRCFQPLFDSPYHITRQYVAEIVGTIQELKSFMFKKNEGFVPLPSGMIFMNRLQFGFYSVLARLNVEADFAAVERRFLKDAGLLR
jgi:predicted unusual protein kinase regulating ubiquinone biosynthesis (AarF/ABC1/UbiB family)